MEPTLTLYARAERTIEGGSPTRAKDVTLWRVYRAADFSSATPKLFAEGPRLTDGTLLFPVARYAWCQTKPTRRQKTVMHNCLRWKLEWI